MQALEVLSAFFEIPLADPVVVAVVAGERGGAGPEGSTYLIEVLRNSQLSGQLRYNNESH